MERDIREMLKIKKEEVVLPKDHRKDFKNKLLHELHKEHQNKEFHFIKIAVAVLLIFGLGFFFIQKPVSQKNQKAIQNKYSLGDLSPEMKKIENYYLTAINFELTNLKVDDENRQLINNYFMKLSQLTHNYKRMNQELDLKEIDEELINKMVSNLQKRLQILTELKKELQKIKTKQNEITKI